MDIFTPPVEIDYESSVSVTNRILVANLGDGYSVRAGDGLNSKKRMWSLNWSVLSIADADTIETFLSDQQGYKAFIWTPPRGVIGKWICQNWNRTAIGPNYDSLACEFEEVYDL